MNSDLERIEISDSELTSFVVAVKTRFGLDFGGYEKKSLKRGLARLMIRHKMSSILELWGLILKDKSMIVSYIDELLINLTEFFRNPDLWQKLKKSVLDELAANPTIHIWHAGCSTGEEVYSMAIVLKERFLFHKSSILGTDLSARALAKAEEGKFSTLFWKKTAQSYAEYNPEGTIDKYFNQEENDFSVIAPLKNNIVFQRHNLVQEEEQTQQFDIIFCRNVMIYFDDTLKIKTLEKIHKALKDKGFFIIGYYDMLPEESKKLFELYCPFTRIYKKKQVQV